MRFPEQRDVVVIDAEPHFGREYGGHNKQAGRQYSQIYCTVAVAEL